MAVHTVKKPHPSDDSQEWNDDQRKPLLTISSTQQAVTQPHVADFISCKKKKRKLDSCPAAPGKLGRMRSETACWRRERPPAASASLCKSTTSCVTRGFKARPTRRESSGSTIKTSVLCTNQSRPWNPQSLFSRAFKPQKQHRKHEAPTQMSLQHLRPALLPTGGPSVLKQQNKLLKFSQPSRFKHLPFLFNLFSRGSLL